MKTRGKGPIETIIAAKILDRFPLSIADGHLRTGHETNRLRLADQRTGKSTDQQRCGIRRGFFMLGIVNAEYMAGILYQSMLKPSSSA